MFGAVLAGHQGRELIVADIKFTEQIAIYHVRVSFPYPPRGHPYGGPPRA